jgi:hypothetical protein
MMQISFLPDFFFFFCMAHVSFRFHVCWLDNGICGEEEIHDTSRPANYNAHVNFFITYLTASSPLQHSSVDAQ